MKRGLALPELNPTFGPFGRRVKFYGALAIVAIFIWLVARPRPYWVAISTAYATLLCITVAPLFANDYFRLKGDEGFTDKARINMTEPLSCLTAALALRAVLDTSTDDISKAFFLGLLVGLPYALFLWVIVRRASFLIAAGIGMGLGPAILLHLNALTLPAHGYVERGVVSSTYTSTKPWRHVVIASIEGSKVELVVPADSLSSYKVGRRICTEVRAGMFGIRQRSIQAC